MKKGTCKRDGHCKSLSCAEDQEAVCHEGKCSCTKRIVSCGADVDCDDYSCPKKLNPLCELNAHKDFECNCSSKPVFTCKKRSDCKVMTCAKDEKKTCGPSGKCVCGPKEVCSLNAVLALEYETLALHGSMALSVDDQIWAQTSRLDDIGALVSPPSEVFDPGLHLLYKPGYPRRR